VGHSNFICSLVSINYEKNLVSASANHKIKIEKEICLKTFNQHENWVLTLLSLPNLKCFVSGARIKK